MNDEAVRDLATDCGISVDWVDADDRPQRVSIDSLRAILAALGLPCRSPPQLRESRADLNERTTRRPLLTTTVESPTPLPGEVAAGAAELVLEDGTVQSLKIERSRSGAPAMPGVAQPGYHRLRYLDREVGLAVAPARCLTVSDIVTKGKPWGIAVQLYGLGRPGDGGIGDTTALGAFAREAAHQGADAIALSPVHSLFPEDPSRYSPYSPSSRLFLNPLLADPAHVLGQARVSAATAADDKPFIDWLTAAPAKYALLRRLYDDFAATDLVHGGPLAGDFRSFVRDGGVLLEAHAHFESSRTGAPAGFHLFLQWIAERSFARAQADARNAGMRIGLISDLAIGVSPDGSQVAAGPGDFLRGLTVGAPPDAFNAHGQGWGLTSFSPQALLANGYVPFIDTLRAAMRHAGGVRIDHAMGLMRLWLVPDGAPPSQGAYLAYPLDDLLRLLALESHRHKVIVIGEDLGTVPPHFRRRCRDAGIAGMDVMWFQRDGNRFLPPDEWRDDAVAMSSTHDLPTVAGWWRGEDLELRKSLGLTQSQEIEERASDRSALWEAMTTSGVAEGAAPLPAEPEPVIDAACSFVACAPGPLALLPLEDVLGLVEQPNLPGTTDEHPNWRRRYPRPAGSLLDDPAVTDRLRAVNERRK
jgi:4-alpha-glucanotransferase